MIRDLKWTRAADVYSFGVLTYEVFSRGLLPFYQIPDDALIQRVITLTESSSTRLLFGPLADALPPSLCVLLHYLDPPHPIKSTWP